MLPTTSWLMKSVGPHRHHDVEQVPGQEGDRRREDEAAVAADAARRSRRTARARRRWDGRSAGARSSRWIRSRVLLGMWSQSRWEPPYTRWQRSEPPLRPTEGTGRPAVGLGRAIPLDARAAPAPAPAPGPSRFGTGPRRRSRATGHIRSPPADLCTKVKPLPGRSRLPSRPQRHPGRGERDTAPGSPVSRSRGPPAPACPGAPSPRLKHLIPRTPTSGPGDVERRQRKSMSSRSESPPSPPSVGGSAGGPAGPLPGSSSSWRSPGRARSWAR